KPAPVPHVADEPAQPRVVPELLACLVLLQFVTGQHHKPAWGEVFQGVGDERLSEGPCPAREQDAGPFEQRHGQPPRVWCVASAPSWHQCESTRSSRHVCPPPGSPAKCCGPWAAEPS